MLLQKEADPLTWLIPGGQNLIFIAAARMREAQEVLASIIDPAFFFCQSKLLSFLGVGRPPPKSAWVFAHLTCPT